MPIIDLYEECKEAYKAYLEETNGLNSRLLPLPKWCELPRAEQRRMMAFANHLIKKFKREEIKEDGESTIRTERIHTRKLKFKSKPKPKSKFKSAR